MRSSHEADRVMGRCHGDETRNKRGCWATDTAANKFLILVVDGWADNVAMLSLDLQKQGYQVVTGTNGEEAISVAFATLPQLIHMEISMPSWMG